MNDRFENLAFAMIFSAVIISANTGCRNRPSLGPPGTISDQRSRAILHDPYPSPDLGPPIAGGRPRGFDLPRSEAAHLQSSPYAQRSRGGAAPPPTGF